MLKKLFDISSYAIEKTQDRLDELDEMQNISPIYSELFQILSKKNGFYCFETALHFYSADQLIAIDSIIKNILGNDSFSDMSFFAQDIFCNQFTIKDEKIYLLDIESLELEYIADNFEDWEKEVLNDYNYFTGYSLCHEWQKIYSKIYPKRLNSKKPFILGGEYNIDNLFADEVQKIIESKLELAKKLIDTKDGDSVEIKV